MRAHIAYKHIPQKLFVGSGVKLYHVIIISVSRTHSTDVFNYQYAQQYVIY